MIRFLDPWMLLFAAAAAAPVFITWLGRRDAVVRDWAAMEILARAADRTAFRRRCVEWLVVAVRSALLMAVAFAAARPLLVPAVLPRRPTADPSAGREPRVVVVGEATAVAAAIESVMPSLVPVRAIAESQLDRDVIESASLVVLADGVVPGPAEARRLSRFVDEGGGVVFLVGPRSTGERAAAFNRFVGGLAGVGIDGRIDRREERVGEEVLLTATPQGDAEMTLSGPVLARTARLVAGVEPPGVAAVPRGPPAVLARAVPSGDPIALKVGVGSGGLGIIAVPLTIEGWSQAGWAAGPLPFATSGAAWTDLPAWPDFLPFVERTILPLMAAGETADRKVSPVAGWLAGRNLSGLALMAALALLAVEPLASRWMVPWSQSR